MTSQRYQIRRETLTGLQPAHNAPPFAALVVVDTRERCRIVARGCMRECLAALRHLSLGA